MHVAGNTVQYQHVFARMEAPGLCVGADKVAPHAHGGFVRDEFALAGVFHKDAPDFAVQAQAAKDIAARAIKESGDGSENPALRAFARAGRAKQQNGSIFHEP